MTLFITLLAVLFGSVLLTRLAQSLAVPYPSLLALGGAVVALIPGLPPVTMEPELVLAIFVAPVLLDAAYDTSPRDLKDNWPAITTLVFVAVGLTTASVAILFKWMVPTAPWGAAIALGAVVAPPDASAATAVLRQIRLPSRLVLILEGESLFNDATALLILAIAVAFVQNPNQTVLGVAPVYGASIIGSIAAGIALGWLYPKIGSILTDPAASIIMQFTGTFAVWIFAQEVGLSPILTIVTYGIFIAQSASKRNNPFIRVQSYAVWDTIVFLMNVLAFVLIGLQLRQVLLPLEAGQLERYLLVAFAVLLTVIVVRVAWVMTFNTFVRAKNRRYGFRGPARLIQPTFNGGLIIAWCGMRGIVTLAAALSLPEDFPERGLIQLCAFAVVLGTLVAQGFTLGFLASRLKLPADNHVRDETDKARRAALKAALNSIDGDTSKYAEALRVEYRSLLENGQVSEDGISVGMTEHEQLRLNAIAAARKAISDLRKSGEIGDEAFHRIEEALDRTELYAIRYHQR
jgi:CPA1 family monovalent cation:H+ antiporter